MGCTSSAPSGVVDTTTKKESAFDKPLDEFRDEEAEFFALSRATQFDIAVVRDLYRIFSQISASKVNDGVIDADELADALGLDPESPLFNEIFRSFDVTRDQKVNFREFVMALAALSESAPVEDKIRFTFSMFDLNKDGGISVEELTKLLQSVIHDRDVGLALSQQDIREVCDATFNDIDKDHNGLIDLSEYREMILSRPGFLAPFTINVKDLLNKRGTNRRTHSRSVAKPRMNDDHAQLARASVLRKRQDSLRARTDTLDEVPEHFPGVTALTDADLAQLQDDEDG